MEKVNIQSLRTIAKIIGTVICVSGAVSIALLKGPKLLNAEKIPSKSTKDTILRSDDNWLLGCLFLLGSNVAYSIWIILQVFNLFIFNNFVNFLFISNNHYLTLYIFKMIIITIIITLYISSAGSSLCKPS
jgi:hypothetical protein